MHTSADQLGVQNGLEAQMQAITQVWKDSVLETQKWLFGGSDEGNAQLGSLISDASMFGDGWLLDRAEHSKEVKRSLNAFMIPLAWSYSPDGLFPFIADAGVPCGEDPGWNDNYQYWIEESAQGNGFCHEGNSYWLLTGRDSNTQCNSVTGDVWCGKFDSPPGYQQLVDKTYSDISLDNVVIGYALTCYSLGKTKTNNQIDPSTRRTPTARTVAPRPTWKLPARRSWSHSSQAAWRRRVSGISPSAPWKKFWRTTTSRMMAGKMT